MYLQAISSFFTLSSRTTQIVRLCLLRSFMVTPATTSTSCLMDFLDSVTVDRPPSDPVTVLTDDAISKSGEGRRAGWVVSSWLLLLRRRPGGKCHDIIEAFLMSRRPPETGYAAQ